MFRFHCRSLPAAATTAATNAILFSTFRNLAVVQRRVGQNNSHKRTAATHQQLSKPKDDSTTGTSEHISPSSSSLPSPSPSSQTPTTFVIREKQLPPIITMPTANQNNDNGTLKTQFGKKYDGSNNVVINRPLEKLFMIINDRIFEQEAFEQQQQQQQQQLQTQQNDQEIINTAIDDESGNNADVQEQKLELLRRQQQKQQREALRTSKMSNDQKAVFLNRYSSTNFSAFATTAEAIIKEFRSTFKMPKANVENNNSKTSQVGDDDKILSLPDSSQLQQHLPKKKKMTTSIHNNHHNNNDENTNDLILHRQKNPSAEGNNNNNSSASSSPLADYCGTSEDVLQLAMIVMQSCVDVAEIATARLLFALVVREVPFDAIPTQFFRLYFLALSRSDTTTLEEFNGLVQLIGGRAAVKQNTVIALCVLEVKLRMGFNVTLGEVEDTLMTNSSKSTSDEEKTAAKQTSSSPSSTSTTFKNGNKINSGNANAAGVDVVATPSSFMMSEESETRLKLRDCFLVAVRSHPDPNIATLLLREWTKLSDLSEFVGETNTIVHFLLAASNNSAATPALCAELISLIEGLSSHQQQNNNNNNSPNENSQSSSSSSSSPSLTSLVTLKTLIKTAARAIRVEDWKSFLTIEKFTRKLFLTSVSSKLEEKKNDNHNNQESNAAAPNPSAATSPEVKAIISSTLSIFKILALIETNQTEKILSSSSSLQSQQQQPSQDEMNIQNKNLAFTMQLCPQLFHFNKKEDLDSNICPFFLDKLMMTTTKTSNKSSSSFATTKLISQKRFELASLINFPISEFPPMTLLLESLTKKSDTCAILLNSKNAAVAGGQPAIQGFPETLILLTAATFERANDIISKQKHMSCFTSTSSFNNNNCSSSSCSSVDVIEILKMYFSSQFNVLKNPSISIFAAPVDSTTNKNNNETTTTSRNAPEGSEGGPYHQHLKEILHLHKSHLIILNSALTFLKLVAGALSEVQHAQRENIETMMLYQEAEENLAAEVQLLVSYLVDDVLLNNESFFEREAEVRGSEIFGGVEIGMEVTRMKREFLLEMSRVLRRNHLKSTCDELEKLATKVL